MGSYVFREQHMSRFCDRDTEGLGMSAVGRVLCKCDRMEVSLVISMSRDWVCRRVTSLRSAVLTRAYVLHEKVTVSFGDPVVEPCG